MPEDRQPTSPPYRSTATVRFLRSPGRCPPTNRAMRKAGLPRMPVRRTDRHPGMEVGSRTTPSSQIPRAKARSSDPFAYRRSAPGGSATQKDPNFKKIKLGGCDRVDDEPCGSSRKGGSGPGREGREAVFPGKRDRGGAFPPETKKARQNRRAFAELEHLARI